MCAYQNSSVQAREEVVHLFPRSRRRKRTSEAESDEAVGSKNGKDADFQGPSLACMKENPQTMSYF